jgi:hypothetical protein
MTLAAPVAQGNFIARGQRRLDVGTKTDQWDGGTNPCPQEP